jgi:hypothetical protein
MFQRTIALSRWILFITLQRKILDLGGKLGISLGNVPISKIILELHRVLECGGINRGIIGKPRSLRVLIGTGRSLVIFVVVRVIGVQKKETGLVVANQEKDEKEWKKWRNVLKSWKML